MLHFKLVALAMSNDLYGFFCSKIQYVYKEDGKAKKRKESEKVRKLSEKVDKLKVG